MPTQNSTPSVRPSKRGLGRGLSALIPESDLDMLSGVSNGPAVPVKPPSERSKSAEDDGDQSLAAPKTNVKTDSALTSEVLYLDLGQIEANPFQPRQIWNETELEDLAASLREHGVLQPILVRPLANSKDNKRRFQLIAGERRWRAAERADLDQIPVIVREVDDKSALELAIIENVQRHDISAVESAQAYRRLADEFGLSQERIAARVGKSRASIANTMRLLDLPTEALEALRKNQITEGHGRALLTASDEGSRRALLRRTLRDHLSVREVERLAREGVESISESTRLPRAGATDVSRLENTLQKSLGAKLKLRARKNGGQIVIDYSSTEELQRIVTKLTGGKE